MLIIGERINSSRTQIAKAIASHNAGFIQNEAKAQVKTGATYIDLNAGSFIGEESKYVKWLIEVVQECIDHPLCIDSPDQKVIKEVLRMVKTAPMINSITLEADRLQDILPLVAEYLLWASTEKACQSHLSRCSNRPRT